MRDFASCTSGGAYARTSVCSMCLHRNGGKLARAGPGMEDASLLCDSVRVRRSTFQPTLVEEGIFSSRKIANAETRGTRRRLEITATLICHVAS